MHERCVIEWELRAKEWAAAVALSGGWRISEALRLRARDGIQASR